MITADHGELFGEWVGPLPAPIYGHTPQLRAEPLIKIPWFVVDGGSRRTVKVGENSQKRRNKSQIANERLKKLGYIQ